jgi:hypothetical protein
MSPADQGALRQNEKGAGDPKGSGARPPLAGRPKGALRSGDGAAADIPEAPRRQRPPLPEPNPEAGPSSEPKTPRREGDKPREKRKTAPLMERADRGLPPRGNVSSHPPEVTTPSTPRVLRHQVDLSRCPCICWRRHLRKGG